MTQEINKNTILVVDDTPENIDILDGILNQHYNIKVATNGPMAIEIAHAPDPPDLILLDIMMPNMDGYQVCKHLKNDPRSRKIPVIFVTTRDSIDDESNGFDLGAVDYITKPVSPTIVAARVKTHLALYDQNKHLETKVRERTSLLKKTRLEIIQRLSQAAEYKDNETGLHVIRMSKYSQQIALQHGLPYDEAEILLQAAPMHDIGKIGIPDNILLKPGKLDKDEWQTMQTHCQIGADIIGSHDSYLLTQAYKVAITHHEKWNGKGYPNGLKGAEIPLFGRIVAIADVFDALTSKRPYKEPWPTEKAVELITSEKGEHFEPDLVDNFLAALPEIKKIKKEFSEENN